MNNSMSCSLRKVSVEICTLAMEIGREQLSGMCKIKQFKKYYKNT